MLNECVRASEFVLERVVGHSRPAAAARRIVGDDDDDDDNVNDDDECVRACGFLRFQVRASVWIAHAEYSSYNR